MAGARDVKRRIKSVDNTRQITRTMELVATSKLKKATDRVGAARPYADALALIVQSLYSPELAERYPILRQPGTPRRAAVLLLTANRGLAGAFNANLIKEARRVLQDLRGRGIETELHVVGKKAMTFFRFRKEPMETTRTDIGDAPTMGDAESIIAPLIEKFVAGQVDAVFLVGSQFRSAMSAPPGTRQVLPIPVPEQATSAGNVILSPPGPVILERMLPTYVRNQLFTALVENAAAEQSARRTAMKNATDNAGEMLEILTSTYNRARQGQITQEIAEIVGGAAALE
jgi:F-type H+-transporting ATPase subunit gamma